MIKPENGAEPRYGSENRRTSVRSQEHRNRGETRRRQSKRQVEDGDRRLEGVRTAHLLDNRKERLLVVGGTAGPGLPIISKEILESPERVVLS
jgi:hypothetical protein